MPKKEKIKVKKVKEKVKKGKKAKEVKKFDLPFSTLFTQAEVKNFSTFLPY